MATDVKCVDAEKDNFNNYMKKKKNLKYTAKTEYNKYKNKMVRAKIEMV